MRNLLIILPVLFAFVFNACSSDVEKMMSMKLQLID